MTDYSHSPSEKLGFRYAVQHRVACKIAHALSTKVKSRLNFRINIPIKTNAAVYGFIRRMPWPASTS